MLNGPGLPAAQAEVWDRTHGVVEVRLRKGGKGSRRPPSDGSWIKSDPEQGYKASLGILRLEKKYTTERLEAACDRALTIGSISYRAVNSILKTGMDRLPDPSAAEPQLDLPMDHANVRGPDYYH